MLLVLPLQTFASASMQVCAMSHPGPVAHQAAMPHTAMADDAMAACHDSGKSDTVPTQHVCDHCPVCHLASALLVPAIAPALGTHFTHGVIPHVDAAFTGFIPDSPERPPRTSCA